MISSRFERVMNYAILTAFAAAVLIPLGVLVLTALSPSKTGKISLTDFRWDNFVTAWVQTDFGRHLAVSAGITVATVVIVVVITPAAAYALSLLKAPGHRWVFPLMLVGLLIPLEGIIVPLYFNLRDAGLTGSPISLVVAHVGLSTSFGVFWMRASFRAVPGALVESAKLDGAGDLRTLISVLLPILNPAIVTLALLTFMSTWNDYFIAFVLINDPEMLPVTVSLGSFATRTTNEDNLMAAAAILVATPIVILYLIFQRRFIAGVLSGALKG
ncbi:carbohydrate ABC transporter permease [Microbacterium sp. p3-SID336]|uniref:carbohydrate ABC transporter permease n=1 Tax=Microbacterium sp. p3-SID336 TaxID=2916212 RepID=UPI0021A47695|nr:carbohydrate ABC transporter permease [Microbacterium sp. p3-SID336]MCT1478876.1 carbohydrate ABC transporter permease [Microbacterium sp. p3-SID336]